MPAEQQKKRWWAALRPLVEVKPHAGAHTVAARVGVSVLVPLLVLQAVGRPEWAIYAAFGAFASLYGRNRLHLSRLRMQSTLAVLLTLAVTGGVAVGTLAERSWVAVPASALVAVAAAVLSDAQDWHPPGPLFVVFAFSACATIPSTPADLVPALCLSAASAAFAVLVGSAGWFRHPRQPRTARPRADRRPLAELLRTGRVRLHLLRYGSAVLVAGSVATASGIGRPYWAMVAAVVPMAAPTLTGQLVRAGHRVAGTVVGLGLSAVLLALHPRGVLLIVLVVALQVAAELLVGRNYGLALVFITPLALLLGEIAGPHPPGPLMLARGLETAIGVAVAVVVTLLVRERSDAAPALPAT